MPELCTLKSIESVEATRLSVNINKIATLRNARGGQTPDVLEAAVRIQEFGAQGITIHPRPDERHIRYADARALRPLVHTEYNIEGYPTRDFIDLVKECAPEQVTLVPDAPDVLTSNAGWDTLGQGALLREVLYEFRAAGIRTSLFIECDAARIEAAAALGADRIELYTEAYATGYAKDRSAAVTPYVEASRIAHAAGLGVNAGHDLNADNLAYFAQSLPYLDEVSIGHAQIVRALDVGTARSVAELLEALGWPRRSFN